MEKQPSKPPERVSRDEASPLCPEAKQGINSKDKQTSLKNLKSRDLLETLPNQTTPNFMTSNSSGERTRTARTPKSDNSMGERSNRSSRNQISPYDGQIMPGMKAIVPAKSLASTSRAQSGGSTELTVQRSDSKENLSTPYHGQKIPAALLPKLGKRTKASGRAEPNEAMKQTDKREDSTKLAKAVDDITTPYHERKIPAALLPKSTRTSVRTESSAHAESPTHHAESHDVEAPALQSTYVAEKGKPIKPADMAGVQGEHVDDEVKSAQHPDGEQASGAAPKLTGAESEAEGDQEQYLPTTNVLDEVMTIVAERAARERAARAARDPQFNRKTRPYRFSHDYK